MVKLEEVEGNGKTLSTSKSHPNRLILISTDDQTVKRGYLIMKRLVDIFTATALLLLLFPFYLVVALLIASNDGMPVLFKHKRVGKHGRDFYVLKFRTMRNDAESYLAAHPELMQEFEKSYKLDVDPRVTPLGRWLRAYSLDELPQLINVLMGTMTMVGPRPVVKDELEKYGPHAGAYLSLKPGCAGLWQCSGRSDTTYEERVQLDLDYARKASFWFDLTIFFNTIIAVFRRHGAR